MSLEARLQHYPVLRITIAIILGIVTGRLTTDCFPYFFWLIAATASLAVAFALRKHPVGQSVAVFLSFFFIGAYLIGNSQRKMSVKLPDTRQAYKAVLLTEPVVHGKVVQTDILIESSTRAIKARASILRDTTANRWKSLHVGDGIEAASVLEEPRNFAGSTFDYATWLKEHGFSAETFISSRCWRKAVVALSFVPRADRVIIKARKFRQHLLAKYHDYGAGGQTYAVLAAMTLGDKSALSREVKDDYSVAGASHVLALSGLHLGIIYYVLLMLTFRFRRKWLPQLLVITAIWTYVVLVGMSASVVRSAIMLTIVSMVTIIGRSRVTVNSLSLAALAMLLWNPLNLYDIGFEMSFLAVLAIVMFSPLLLPKHPARSIIVRMARKVWDIVAVSIAAQLGTAPLVAFYFGRFSCYFFITNLIVIPCALLILYGSVAVVVLSWSAAAAGWMAHIVMTITAMMNSALHWIASLPGASIENISLSKAQVLGLYIIIITLYLFLTTYPKENHAE